MQIMSEDAKQSKFSKIARKVGTYAFFIALSTYPLGFVVGHSHALAQIGYYFAGVAVVLGFSDAIVNLTRYWRHKFESKKSKLK